MDAARLQVDDPIIGNAGARIETGSLAEVVANCRVADFDQQENIASDWVGVTANQWRRPHEIRLRLTVELWNCNWHLHPHIDLPFLRVFDAPASQVSERARMRRSLRSHLSKLPVE